MIVCEVKHLTIIIAIIVIFDFSYKNGAVYGVEVSVKDLIKFQDNAVELMFDALTVA